MTLGRLVLANLCRKPSRSLLTVGALAVAFLLFMLLRAIAVAFAGGVTQEGLDRLVVDSRYSMTENLPLAHVERIRALDEVEEVAHMTWFAGYVRDPANTFAIYPVEPRAYFRVMSDQRIAPEVLDRLAETRTGAVASASLARRQGWQVGEVIPLRSELYPKADGSKAWPLTLVGTFDYAEDGAGPPLLLFQYDHYNESVALWGRNQVYWIVARASANRQVEEAIAAIDGLFENSPNPTRSTPEDEYRRQFASQLGDIGSITTIILSAVFFTIVLLTGNNAMQAYRERRSELAVLKTLGFPDTRVALIVLAEPAVLCLCGAICGIAIALLLEGDMNASLSGMIGGFRMTASSATQALALAGLLALAVGLPPALAARRRPIVDGLREG